jgi:Ca2+-transporting ATPase
MAAFHRKDNATVAYVKGAPRRVIELCNRVRLATGDELLDSTSRDLLLAINEGWASRGLRVLALASGEVESASEGSLAGLTFVGFLGLTDPPAPGVKRTIAQLREAGLRTIMVTGDQRLTAETIGRELGLLGDKDRVIDGRELAGLTTTELESRLSHVGAFSRVTPRDKLAIVEALQARGEIVAMLGDGVNDAPALKKADVGVAMGLRGTDVAKEAAAIVLQNDQFQTVAAAVEEGRVIYDNIRKFVFYLFSCNLAEILVLLIAGLIALPPPILPLQILWINIVTDTLPALALAVEPRDPDVMRRPPRHPREALLSRAFLYSVALYAAIITFATLAAFLWGLWQSPGQATTMSFMALALAQIFHLGNARSPNAVLQPARAVANPYALAAVVASVGLQILPVGIPLLRDLLRLTSLGAAEWGVVLSAAAAPGLIGQAVKVILARRTSII